MSACEHEDAPQRGPSEDDAPSYEEALDGLVRQARAVVESWTYLRDVKVSTLGQAISPAGALVELSNALYHLEGHLEDLERATPVTPPPS